MKSETLEILAKYSWWVQNDQIRDPNLLKLIDKACVDLEQALVNKSVLKQRAHRIFPNEQENEDWKNKPRSTQNKSQREYERQVLSLITEVLAANELIQQGFSDIEFIPESDEKTPDLSARKGGNLYLVEAKQMRSPIEEDEALRKRGSYTSEVSYNYRTMVRKKAEDFALDAVEKFKSYDRDCKDKILIINFQHGIDVCLVPDTKPVKRSFWEELGNKFNIEVWYRTYFIND